MPPPASSTRGVASLGAAGPGVGMAQITPSDTNNIVDQGYARSLFIVGAGNIHCTGLDGVEFTVAVPANFILPVAVTKVWAASTTATPIFAIW